MKKLYLIIILFCMTTLAGFAQETPSQEYKNEFKKYIELSGATAAYEQFIDQIAKMTVAGVDDQKLTVIREKVIPGFVISLVDIMSPAYIEAGITIDDLKAVNQFHSTPVGVKLGKAQPVILKNTVPKGQEIMSSIQSLISEAAKEL